MMLQQQFEMQQRQMQQMYHEHQERHRSGMGRGHQMQPSTLLMPTIVGSASFETSGEYSVPSYPTSGSEQHPSVMTVVGSSPILIPMAMPGARAPAGIPSSVAQGSQEQRKGMGSQPHEGSYAALGDRERKSQPIPAQHGKTRTSGTESPFSPGKMNPQATVFAPSYMNLQANPPTSHQIYFPFDPTHAQGTALYYRPASQHPAVYTHGVMYVPTTLASSKGRSQESRGANTQASANIAPSAAGNGPRNNRTDSQASEKENVRSAP
jgi:hypothetical protein